MSRSFWGTTENAVRIQISSAIIAIALLLLYNMMCNLSDRLMKFFRFYAFLLWIRLHS